MAISLKNIFTPQASGPKTYATYQQALEQCKNEGYEDSDLCRIIAKKTLRYREELKLKPYIINPVHCYLTLVIQQILLAQRENFISIADFGGACGAHYYETRRLVNNDLQLKWNVIETPAMVSSANNYMLGNNELQFVSDFESLDADLFYLSSSIQYVPAPYQVLDKVIAKGCRYVLFNRMMLNTLADEDEVIVQQSRLSANGPGPLPDGELDREVYYPHTTLSLKKFMKQFEPEYDLVLRFDEPSGKISNSADISGGGFLFRRK